MTYSIDWPLGFTSRTSNPDDPCFIGKLGNTKGRSHAPNEKSVTALSKQIRLNGAHQAPEMMKRSHRKKYTP